ncbi:MAG: hypothetical protein WAK20_10565 [Candidatus Acidiferrum sp.]
MSSRFKHHLSTRVAPSAFQTLHALTPEVEHRQEPRVATAADLQVATAGQFAKYRTKTKQREVRYVSTEELFAQMQNGAPFGLFSSADVASAARPADQVLAKQMPLYHHASGFLAGWPNLDIGRQTFLRHGFRAAPFLTTGEMNS